MMIVEPTVNGEEALGVHRTIDALLESGASGLARGRRPAEGSPPLSGC